MGSPDGEAVGLAVGSSVGTPGVYVGDSVGTPEGAAVGFKVG